MKVKINGFDVEGTVKEICELIGLKPRDGVEDNASDAPKKERWAKVNRKIKITDETVKKIALYAIRQRVTISVAAFAVCGYISRPLRLRVRTLIEDMTQKEYSIKGIRRGTHTKINHSAEHRDKARARMKYIKSRINKLMKADPQCTYEKAFRIASDEYGTKYRKPKSINSNVSKDAAPAILLDVGMNKILIDMLARISDTGGTLTRKIDGEAINMGDKKMWGNMCMSILRDSDIICKYLNKTGRYILSNDGDEMIIEYRG